MGSRAAIGRIGKSGNNDPDYQAFTDSKEKRIVLLGFKGTEL
jgi:hypothetical protein